MAEPFTLNKYDLLIQVSTHREAARVIRAETGPNPELDRRIAEMTATIEALKRAPEPTLVSQPNPPTGLLVRMVSAVRNFMGV